MSARALAAAATVLLVGLIALGLAWELVLAPLRPGGSWLALKVLPLAAALPGFLRRRRYTFQWMSMLVLVYLAEGIVRAWSEQGASRTLAAAQTALAALLFLAAALYARATRPGAARPV
ncbi:MAG: DUF2069 domain-containing protein [Burkholderiales bacterium]|nr:DUF2069 domain-containing protein [Burkholderiales bacterium]